MTEETPVHSIDLAPFRRVCVNLTERFNKCAEQNAAPYCPRPCEMLKLRRQRLKSLYHLQPHPFFQNCDASDSKAFTCEIDSTTPSLRKQLLDYAARKNSSSNILKGMDIVGKTFRNTLPPYDFSRYDVFSSEPYQVFPMTAGEYLHFGIAKNLQCPEDNNISTIAVDIGLYMTNTNVRGASWPTFLTIYGEQAATHNTFVIGVYYGKFPIEIIANEILQPFVAEVLQLQRRGISGNNRIFSFAVNCIIADSVANSFATCTTMPRAMYGCSKCKVVSRLNNLGDKTIYPSTTSSAALRDDDDFKFCVVTEHHLVTPVLAEIGIGLISQVSIDYKHTVCLGVMEKLIELWMAGDLTYRLNREKIEAVNTELMELASSCPLEFLSGPKPLDKYKMWSAYDFRQFLIYYGPVVLRSNLSTDHYINFLYLNLAMRIALDDKNSEDINFYIFGQLIHTFVRDFSVLYDMDNVDYNIHNLLHLEAVLRKYHCLENVGGFKFQPKIEEMEKLTAHKISHPNWPLSEMAKLVDGQKTGSNNGKRVNIKFNRAIVSSKEPNNYFMLRDGMVKINSMGFNGSGRFVLHGHRIQKALPFTDISTTNQNVVEIFEFGGLEEINPEDIICKLVALNTGSNMYTMPLLSL